MKYRSALFTAGIVVVVALTSSFASRAALGLVVDSCKLNFALTGSTFPCLKMVHPPQPLAAYAVLREPAHKERTILTPLADVSGIEDPRLVAGDGPNYFDYAWNERSIVLNDYPQKDSWQDAALAINAEANRTQDHLHIHIGCISPPLKSALNSHAGDIDALTFRRIRTKLRWRSFFVKFYKADNLSDINPFQLVADGVAGARADMQDVAIGVVGASRGDGQRGFYILAQINGDDDSYGSAEDLLDAKCRR
ncbi:MAG: CDP-diacylglycerol diphosphatase [Rhizobium sp.]